MENMLCPPPPPHTLITWENLLAGGHTAECINIDVFLFSLSLEVPLPVDELLSNASQSQHKVTRWRVLFSLCPRDSDCPVVLILLSDPHNRLAHSTPLQILLGSFVGNHISRVGMKTWAQTETPSSTPSG